MKPYLKSTRVNFNNTPITYATAYGWTEQVKTNSCLFICSFGGTINGTHTPVGDKIYLVTNSDYHTYCKSIGVESSTLYLYIDTPSAITTDPDSIIENVMDCSMCCMNQCTIVLSIFSGLADFYNCFQTMLAGYTFNDGILKPTHITISWGCPENQISSIDKNVPSLIENCGVSIFAASGDNNATDGTNTLMVDFPSSCPYIIGVGGTTLKSTNPLVETVWNNSGYGTGGGVSQLFSKPSYQTITGTKRMVPDVCAVSDPNTGVTLCINGTISGGYGGTSMAAPFVCAMYAICQYKYNITAPLYSFLYKANCFHDIVSGNNVGYSATIGYDPCTGLGSILWPKMMEYLSTTPKPIPTTSKISIKIQVNKTYPFSYPITYISPTIKIQKKSIRVSKIGNFIITIPTPSMLYQFTIIVVRNINIRFALST